MSVWLEHERDEFNQYIEKNSNEKEALGLLIQNFAPFWNREFFGALSLDSFNYMIEIIDMDLVYSKLEKYYPDLIESNIESFDFNGKDHMSIEDNVKQFIYHYREKTKTE